MVQGIDMVNRLVHDNTVKYNNSQYIIIKQLIARDLINIDYHK